MHIDYSVETDGWDDIEQNVVTFKFYRRFSEEDIKKKKDEILKYIGKCELKCKEIENKIREMITNG